jgi:hypothetical protein
MKKHMPSHDPAQATEENRGQRDGRTLPARWRPSGSWRRSIGEVRMVAEEPGRGALLRATVPGGQHRASRVPRSDDRRGHWGGGGMVGVGGRRTVRDEHVAAVVEEAGGVDRATEERRGAGGRAVASGIRRWSWRSAVAGVRRSSRSRVGGRVSVKGNRRGVDRGTGRRDPTDGQQGQVGW